MEGREKEEAISEKTKTEKMIFKMKMKSGFKNAFGRIQEGDAVGATDYEGQA